MAARAVVLPSLVGALAGLLAPLAATADEAAAPGVAARAPARDVGWELMGRTVYLRGCASCHGERGDGKGPAARQLDPPPRDFTAGVYKFRSTASGSLPLVEDVERTIAEGVPGTAMPAWREHLGDDERRAVAEYVLGYSSRYREEDRPERIVPPPEALVILPSTPARIARGRALYHAAGCHECHGERGHGDGRASHDLKDDAGRPIAPLDFTRGLYKGGGRPADVYRTFVTGLDGTPMPSFASALADENDRWSLVHFVRSLTRPPGLWNYLFGRQTAWE